jgi:hypothetical protein
MSEQREQIPQEIIDKYVEKWLKIGLCTEPTDFERAKAAARLAYKCAGVQCPELFYLCDSPLQGVVYAHFCETDQVDRLNELDRMQPKERLQFCLDFIKSNRGKDFLSAINSYSYGSQDAPWLACYDLFEIECGVKECEQLHGLRDMALCCGWWAPFDGAVIFQHRACEIHMQDGELHNDSGPAILYPDGYALWAITGIVIPVDHGEQVVMRPETQTLEQIRQESNEELKRIRIERFGWPRYLQESNAKVIEHRYNEIEQVDESLMETDSMRILVCACPSTARIYAMEVPPDTETCMAAQQYLFPDFGTGTQVGAS